MRLEDGEDVGMGDVDVDGVDVDVEDVLGEASFRFLLLSSSLPKLERLRLDHCLGASPAGMHMEMLKQVVGAQRGGARAFCVDVIEREWAARECSGCRMAGGCGQY